MDINNELSANRVGEGAEGFADGVGVRSFYYLGGFVLEARPLA